MRQEMLHDVVLPLQIFDDSISLLAQQIGDHTVKVAAKKIVKGRFSAQKAKQNVQLFVFEEHLINRSCVIAEYLRTQIWISKKSKNHNTH